MSEVVRYRTHSPEETRDLAGAVAGLLQPGDVVAFSGELGAGKTCFVQGAARALGVEGRVTSPTFMLMRRYEGDLEVIHVDVYRLDNLADVRDLGEDVFGPDVVTFLEWGDAVEPLLPDDHLEVEIVLGDALEDRVVAFRGHGAWADRLVGLASHLDGRADGEDD